MKYLTLFAVLTLGGCATLNDKQKLERRAEKAHKKFLEHRCLGLCQNNFARESLAQSISENKCYCWDPPPPRIMGEGWKLHRSSATITILPK